HRLLLGRSGCPAAIFGEREDRGWTAAPTVATSGGAREAGAALLAVRAAVLRRRLLEAALERAVEGRFRLVADLGRDLEHAAARRPQRFGPELEAPVRQIGHRRLPEVAREPLGQRG